LNDKVYSINPRTELKEIIRREIANIPAEQLQKVNENPSRQCEKCLRVKWQHLQRLLLSVKKGKNFPSFRTVWAAKQSDSLAKFVFAAQPEMHRSPWNRSTK
jgi:hypothetical protein